MCHSLPMSNIIQKIKRTYKQVRGLFPSTLPVGITEFNAWVDDIKATYSLPTDSQADIVFCFSAVIMRFDQIVDKKPKYYFVKALRSGAAKQVAQAAFTQLKEQHIAAQKAAAAEAANNEPKV